MCIASETSLEEHVFTANSVGDADNEQYYTCFQTFIISSLVSSSSCPKTNIKSLVILNKLTISHLLPSSNRCPEASIRSPTILTKITISCLFSSNNRCQGASIRSPIILHKITISCLLSSSNRRPETSNRNPVILDNSNLHPISIACSSSGFVPVAQFLRSQCAWSFQN